MQLKTAMRQVFFCPSSFSKKNKNVYKRYLTINYVT